MFLFRNAIDKVHIVLNHSLTECCLCIGRQEQEGLNCEIIVALRAAIADVPRSIFYELLEYIAFLVEVLTQSVMT